MPTKHQEPTMRVIQRLWERSEGKGWEPPDPHHPLIEAMLEHGWLRRADGRFMFEAFKDSHVVWTQAAKTALGAVVSPSGA